MRAVRHPWARPLCRARHRRPDEAGFGLIELIVSLSVFSILMGGVIVSITTGLGLARNNRQRTVAANLASQEMDAIRQTDFASLVPGLTSSDVDVDGVEFDVARNLEWVATDATTGACDSNNTDPEVLRVTVNVTWKNMGPIPPVSAATELSPPVGSYDASLGHIAVTIRDGSAEPLGAVPVRVTGPGVDQTFTSTDEYAASPGCAFFGFLAPGTYTVSLGSTGFVDRQGVTTPSQTVGVNAGQVTSVAFDYDQAAGLGVTIEGVNGGTPADAMNLTLANTGFVPTGRKVFAGTGATRSLTGLFPFVDGYAGWAGSCADADPEGKATDGTDYWPGAQRADAFEVIAGTTTDVIVPVATVQVDFVEAGAPDGTDTIQAVHAADAGCSAGETLTIATFPSATGTALVGLPYGTWTIRAVGKSPVGAWPVVSLDPQSVATTFVTVSI